MNEITDTRLFRDSDFYLVPLCLLLMFIFMYIKRRKYNGLQMQRYFIPALVWRLVFVFFYAVIVQYYYGAGDTLMYYRGVTDMYHAVSDDWSHLADIFLVEKMEPSNPIYTYFMYDGHSVTHYYMENAGTFAVCKFALPFSLLFGNSYVCISFCLSLFSFAGCWRIYKMFCEMFPRLQWKFALSILFLPSILFWGGSLLKDSICMGSMGFALYAAYQIFFTKRKVFVSLIILLACCTLLLYIKPYILLCLLPAFILWMFLGFRKRIVNSGVRRLATLFLFAGALVGGVLLLGKLTQTELASQYSTERIVETAQGLQDEYSKLEESTGSGYSVGPIGDSFASLLLLFPLGVITTFFRPFLFEVRNPLMLISALEAFAFLCLIYMAFRKIGFRRFFKTVFSSPVLVFCFVFAFVFAGIVGVTTANFGSLARYKIPCLPFFLMMVFIVMDQSGKFSPSVVFGRRLF